MVPFEDQVIVDLVAQHHDVAIADGLLQIAHVRGRHHRAGGIVRRIDDDQARAAGDETAQFAHVGPELALLAQRQRHRPRAHELDHGLINGKAGIGEDHLVARIGQREHGEEDDRFAARDHHHFVGRNMHAARRGDLARDGLAQFRHSGRRVVVRVAVMQCIHGGIDDVRRRIEIGFADLQVDDVSTLPLQRPGSYQDFKRRFRTQLRHPLGQTQFRHRDRHRTLRV